MSVVGLRTELVCALVNLAGEPSDERLWCTAGHRIGQRLRISKAGICAPPFLRPHPGPGGKEGQGEPGECGPGQKRSIKACTTPVEFVNQIVYDGVPAEVVQFATQLPDTWSNLVAQNKLLELIRARRQLAESSIAFWRRMFPVALGIAVSMVGIKHMTLGLENYGVNPDDKRSFWFMCLVLAALNTSAMGPGRPHLFVITVWELTMRNFMVPCQERDGRSGGGKRVPTAQGILALSVPV